ncbi:MAG: restriction endonuclease subunit S [Rubrivivax sp.]|nr:restriction endonuclease subunit S [Rubrivivax sp.]
MALTISVQDLVANSANPLLKIRPHWSRVRLGAIGSVLNGAPFKSEQFSREVGMPLIRIRDVGRSSTDTKYVGDFDERYVVRAGDLLVGMDGDFHCARWCGEPGLLNQRVCKVTVDEAVYDHRFLDCVLPAYLRAINEATSSVTVKHLSSRSIEDIPLPLPPKEEQRRVADEIEKQFSRLDEAVANLQRVKQRLKAYKQSVLDAAIAGRLVGSDSVESTAGGEHGSAGESFRESVYWARRVNWPKGIKFNEPAQPDQRLNLTVPNNWAKVSWEAVLAPEEGAFKRGPFGSALTKAMFVSSGYKVYEQYCPINDDCSFVRYYITPEKFEEMKGFAVQAGDFLISCSGVTLGRITRVPEKFNPGVINQALLRVRLNVAVMDPQFFIVLFRSPRFQSFIFDRTAGAAIPNVRGVGDLKSIPVPVPPLAEQHRIVAEVDRRLSIVRGVEAEVDANLKRAQSLRQAVLANAFAAPETAHATA